MSDTEDTSTDIPLTKQKRHYEKTPAREEAIKRMIETRQKNIELRNAEKTLKAHAVMEKHKSVKLKEDQPPVKKPVAKKIQYVEESEEEDDEEEEIIIVQKKNKPK